MRSDAEERQRQAMIDHLADELKSPDPAVKKRADRIFGLAGVLAKVRRGESDVCVCGYCGRAISLNDIDVATRYIDHWVKS